MSASGITTMWFLAPPSACTRLPLTEPVAKTYFAIGVEPTKLTAATRGSVSSVSTASLSPFTTFSTPGGAPASSISSARRMGQDGSFSEGLRMKVLPQAIATGNIHIGTIAGKLKGVIPAHTPSGWRIEYRSMPAEMLPENSPFIRCGMPQANSTTSRPRWIEPLASESTLPCSFEMRSASSSMCRSINSLNRNITRARARGEVSDQPAKASLALAIARSTSAFEARGTLAASAPVVGLNTSPKRPPFSPRTCLPPMKWASSRTLASAASRVFMGGPWIIAGGALLDRCPRFAHHLAPLVVVGFEVGAELRGRVRVGLHAGRGDEFLHLVGAHELRDLVVQLRDDVARRSHRRQQADPHDRLVAGDARLGDGRHLGNLGRALRRAHAERLQSSRFHVRNRDRRADEAHLDDSRHQVLLRRPAALVRHVVELDPGHVHEELGDEVLRAAVAGAGEVDLARLLLRSRDQLLHRIHPERGVHDPHVRPGGDADYLREVGERVVRHRLVHVRRDHERRGGEEQRVAVRLRLRHVVRSDRASGAGPVLDEELLPEGLGELLRDDAPGHVGRAARRKRDHDAHRTAWISLRRRRGGKQQGEAKSGKRAHDQPR